MKKRIRWMLKTMLCSAAVFAAGQAAKADVYPYTMGNQTKSTEITSSGAQASRLLSTSLSWNKINGICYNAYGQKIPGAITRGIDVSQWQGAIDWNKVKTSNVDFAFIRCGYTYQGGGQTNYVEDTQFRANINGINKAGIPAGVYLYTGAKNTTEIRTDAKRLINAVKGYKISYPLVIDMEEQWQQNLGRTTVTAMFRAFCDEIKRAGYYPMVYSNLYWTDNFYYPQQLPEYDFWLAAYKDSSTGLSSNYRHTIWQATSGTTSLGLMDTTGMIAGIPIFSYGGNVDIDFGYVDYTKKIIPRYQATAAYQGNATVNGWITETNGAIFYYENGKAVTGLKTIGGKTYYFAKSNYLTRKAGTMMKNTMLKVDGSYMYFNSKGERFEKGWLTYKEHKYYMQNGKGVKGLYKIDGKYYYFKLAGYRAEKERIRYNGKIYYFKGDGTRYQEGWLSKVIGGKVYHYYYSRVNGAALEGFRTVSGNRYYFRTGLSGIAGSRAESCKLFISGKWYQFDKDGLIVK